MIRLAIVGSRHHNDYEKFCKHVHNYIEKIGKPQLIISGGASGIDTMAKRFATENNYEFIEYIADWTKYGKSAGPKRNQLIVNDATHMLAFPLDGPGTKDVLKKMNFAKKKFLLWTRCRCFRLKKEKFNDIDEFVKIAPKLHPQSLHAFENL